jgi:hypothetical protein
LVDLATIPLETRSGFRRSRTRASFIRARLLSITLSYLVLDACSVIMTRDPYFVFGPTSVPLPKHLALLSRAALFTYRSLLAFSGMIGALQMLFGAQQLTHYLFFRWAFPRSARADLWHYPTIFGSPRAVLDYGLAGFWGGWWHQSFRAGFAAPTLWALRRGHLVARSRRARLAGGLVAFAQSGLLHASGAVSGLGPTRPWLPPCFFLASWAGVCAQEHLRLRYAARLDVLPRAVRRAGNLAFAFAWLHATQWLFVDDLGRAGLWLFEPVPLSPARWLGFGGPDAAVWRYGWDDLPRWYWGRHWWETGVAI